MDADQTTSPVQEEPETIPTAPEPPVVFVPETLPEATTEPVTEPAPEVIQPPTPVNNLPEPVIVESPTAPVAPQEEPLQISDINSQFLEPQVPSFDVNSLSDEQLKAASALYAKKNQKALSQKGVEKRRAIASQNISEITTFIGAHSPASNRTIARALNLPPRRVQHYMQILTHNGTVTATGWGASRQYFKK